jgi:hypothetical protein
LKPFGVEKSLDKWLSQWRGDGIIAAVKDPASDVIVHRGIPVVDVVGVLRHEHVPLVHTNDKSVGRLGAEHLLERGFRNFGFCEYTGEFWSIARREGFVDAVCRQSFNCAVYEMPFPGPGWGGPEAWEQQQRSLAEWLKRQPKPLGVMTTTQSPLPLKVHANPRLVSATGARVEPFKGPVAILVDGLPGSASECFSGGMQSLGRARVFGQTSMGQALPAFFDKLPNGDILIHATGDFVTADGTRLEGRGVVPDEMVPLVRSDLLAGKDRTLDAALTWIDQQAQGAK